MATTEKTDPEAVKTVEPPPPPPPGSVDNFFALDIGLRVLLFAATLVALVVMVTADQTKLTLVPGVPFAVAVKAKFSHSPAFIYFAAALSAACLYSIISTLSSFLLKGKSDYAASKFLIHLIFWDVLMLGIVAAATGTAGGVAYVGLRGNSHVGWVKICPVYGKFCKHLGSSIAISLLASVLLLLLAMGSVCSLHRRVHC